MRTGHLQALLFDLDGTLVDSSEHILSSFRHTMRVHRGEVPPDSRWLATMGRPLDVQLREFADSEEEARAMRDTFRDHQRRSHDRLATRFPSVRRVLRELRDRGFELGVVTSKEREGALLTLEKAELPEDWFGTVVGADDVDDPKPAPAPVLLALRRIGPVAPERALFVGDSVHDLRSGRSAGVRTAAALWGPYGRDQLRPARPDVWLEGMEEVPRVVAELGERSEAG